MISKLRPNAVCNSIWDIDIQELRNKGIRLLMVDLDNTLVEWRKYACTPELGAWLEKVRNEGLEVCIVSNSRSCREVAELASSLRIYAVTRAGKPGRGGFRKALALLSQTPERSCVIGDQIFTDVLGGNRLGCHTVLVRPLGKREFLGTRFMRIIESLIHRWTVAGVAGGSSNETGRHAPEGNGGGGK